MVAWREEWTCIIFYLHENAQLAIVLQNVSLKCFFLATINYILLHSSERFFSLKFSVKSCPTRSAKRLEKAIWGHSLWLPAQVGAEAAMWLLWLCKNLSTSTFWIHNQSWDGSLKLAWDPLYPSHESKFLLSRAINWDAKNKYILKNISFALCLFSL